MQTLEIKGKKWMVGVEWEILPSDAPIKQESKEVAEKTNSKYGVIVEYDSTFAIGLTKKIGKEPSAALYLAIANQTMRDSGINTDYPDWIVLEEVSEDRYWMSVIKSGIPAPQFDAILSITEVKERITELLINDTYTVFTSSGEIITIFDGIKNIENRNLNDLTQEVKTKLKFDKLLGIPNSVIYASAGLMAIAVLGYFGLQFVEGRSIQEKANYIAQQKEREQKEQEDQYKQSLAVYNAAKVKASEDENEKIIAGLSGNPSKILQSFYDNVGSATGGTHGWKMKEIECYYENAPTTALAVAASNNTIEYPRVACDYLYERTSLATTRMLLEDFPEAKINGDKATVTQKIKIESQYVEKADKSILDTLQSAKNWGFDVQSQLQLLKVADIDHEIKPSTEITYQVNGAPLSPQEQAAGKGANPPETINLGIGVGEIIIRGSNFDLVKELAENVDFSGTGLKKVNFKVEDLGSVKWEATFNYYIKTSDGGIGASTTQTQDKNGQVPQNQQNVTQ